MLLNGLSVRHCMLVLRDTGLPNSSAWFLAKSSFIALLSNAALHLLKCDIQTCAVLQSLGDPSDPSLRHLSQYRAASSPLLDCQLPQIKLFLASEGKSGKVIAGYIWQDIKGLARTQVFILTFCMVVLHREQDSSATADQHKQPWQYLLMPWWRPSFAHQYKDISLPAFSPHKEPQVTPAIVQFILRAVVLQHRGAEVLMRKRGGNTHCR